MSNILRWSVWRHRWESAIFSIFHRWEQSMRGKRFFPTLVRSAMRVHFQSLISCWRGWGNFATWATAGMRERTKNVVYPVRSRQCAESLVIWTVDIIPSFVRRRRRAIGSHGPITSQHIAMIRHAEKRGEINKFQSLLFFPPFLCVWLNNFVKQTKCQPLYDFNRVDFKSKGNSKRWAGERKWTKWHAHNTSIPSKVAGIISHELRIYITRQKRAEGIRIYATYMFDQKRKEKKRAAAAAGAVHRLAAWRSSAIQSASGSDCLSLLMGYYLSDWLLVSYFFFFFRIALESNEDEETTE